MTISSSTSKTDPYVGNSSTTNFPFSFKVFSEDELSVVLTVDGVDTELALNSDYSASLNSDQNSSPGGHIVYPLSGSPLASTGQLIISRDVAYTQETDLLDGGSWNPDTVENALDKITMLAQQLLEALNRAIKTPIGSSDGVSVDLPAPAALRVLQWNAGATALQNALISEFTSVTGLSAWNVEQFSGDDSTVTFTLSDDPGNENNCQIYISGVYQQKDAYTVSGAVITFSEAPPTGTDNIEVVYPGTTALGSIDAADSTFLAAGGGSFARTVQDKLRETLSVEDKGSDCDGSDDSAAFTAAIADLTSGGMILVSCQLSARVVWTQHNIWLQGQGVKKTTITNTGAAGEYTLDCDHGAQATAKLPMSVNIRDLTLNGGSGNGLSLTQVKNGGARNVEINTAGTGLKLSSVFNAVFDSLFFRNYDTGVTGDASNVSNNNTFRNLHFFDGNAGAVPIDTTGINQSLFEEIVLEGSNVSGISVSGTGNTFINPRFESLDPDAGPYISMSGRQHRVINPLLTLAAADILTTQGRYLIECAGTKCNFDNVNIDIPTRVLKFTSDSNQCEATVDTTYASPLDFDALVMDYGDNNTIHYNNNDHIFNNEITWSDSEVTNYFTESIDFSDATADGCTGPTAATGADARSGPLQEGNISKFVPSGGNKRWYQDIAAEFGTISDKYVFVFSVWLKSLTSGGEYVKILIGDTLANAEADAVSVFIPDTKFVRVFLPYRVNNASGIANLYVGLKFDATSSAGAWHYAPQVVFSGTYSNTDNFIDAPFSPMAYVPTGSEARTVAKPNHSLDRYAKAVPSGTNGVFKAGQKIWNLAPAVGQPVGWVCVVSGTTGVGTWASMANLA